MTDLGAGWDLLILVVVSFVPALIYLGWIRGTERYGKEGWGPLLRAFVIGAFFATILAGILESVIVAAGTAVSQNYPGPEFVFLNGNSDAGVFFLVLVVAPFIEEGLKASGVASFRSRFRQLADGPVFGASVGLGFGFFETFLYGLGAYFVGGLSAGLTLIVVRSVSSVVLHGSSTGMFGYGYAKSQFQQPGPGSGSYYLVAVGMHASFNALASLSVILAVLGIGGFANDAASFLALFAAIFFAFWAIEHVRSIIQASDYPGLLAGNARGRPPSPPQTPGRR
jgi:RsiW-degrading membrane proteinase PrsW (M82 family)